MRQTWEALTIVKVWCSQCCVNSVGSGWKGKIGNLTSLEFRMGVPWYSLYLIWLNSTLSPILRGRVITQTLVKVTVSSKNLRLSPNIPLPQYAPSWYEKWRNEGIYSQFVRSLDLPQDLSMLSWIQCVSTDAFTCCGKKYLCYGIWFLFMF